jgi:hypothetical protein
MEQPGQATQHLNAIKMENEADLTQLKNIERSINWYD